MNCTQPDCKGVITDGYCDVCGMAPRNRSAAVSHAQPPATDGTSGVRAPGSLTTQVGGTATAVLRRSGTVRTSARLTAVIWAPNWSRSRPSPTATPRASC